MIRAGDHYFPVIFPDALVHADVAKCMGGLVAETVSKEAVTVSAGSVRLDGAVCHDRSETLKLSSRECDSRIIQMHDYEHGIASLYDEEPAEDAERANVMLRANLSNISSGLSKITALLDSITALGGAPTMKTRKTADEVAAEIAKLTELKPKVRKEIMMGNNREAIQAQIDVLTDGMDASDVDLNYGDPADEYEYVHTSAMEALDWREGNNTDTPSESWQELVEG